MPQLRLSILLPGLGMLGSLSGCQAVFRGLYGMQAARPVEEAELQQLASRYGVPAAQLAVFDTSYRQFLAGPLRPEVRKNHYQPLQAAYYDRTGQLRVFYVNCYAGGFPNLTWNHAGSLNQFPPAPQAPLDSALALPTYLRYLRRPDGQPLPAPPAADYTVVVWSQLMGRQSHRLIKAVQRNVVLTEQPVRILFVNNDNVLYYLAEKSARQQKMAGK